METLKKSIDCIDVYDIHTDFDSKFFRVNFVINVGSGAEDDTEKGISHFIEHSIFGGNPLYSREEIITVSSKFGGNINAYTSDSQTCFYITVLKEFWKETMDLLFNLVFFASFSDETIAREKKVVIEELLDYKDDPNSVIVEDHMKAVYAKSPLADPVIGYQEIISNLTREKVLEFYKKYYVKENFSLFFSGIPFKYVSDYINEVIDRLPSGEKVTRNGDYTVYSKNNLFFDASKQSKVFATVEIDPEDYFTAEYLANIIGSGMNSYLFKELRIKHNLCYSTGSFIWTYPDVILMCMDCSFSDSSKKDDITDILNDSFDKVVESLNDELMESTLIQLKAAYYKQMEHPSNLLEITKMFIRDIKTSPSTYIKNIEAVTIEDIINLTNKLKGKLAITFLLPDTDLN